MRFYTVKELQTNGKIEELDAGGVYVIECIPTGEQYVGSTSRSFRIRWKEFRKHSRNKNSKVSRLLHQKWEEHGDDGFKFGVLEVCDNPKEREQYWIDTLNPTLNINKSTDNSNPNFDERWEEYHTQGLQEYKESEEYKFDTFKRAVNFKKQLALDDREFIITKSNHRLWCLTNELTNQRYYFQSLKRFARDNNIPHRSLVSLATTKYKIGWSLKVINI